MPAVVGDFHEVKIFVLATDQLGINIRHFQVVAVGGTIPSNQEVADAYSDTLAPIYAALLPGGATFYGVAYRRLLPGVPTTYFTSRLGTTAGTATGSLQPRQASGLITLRTGLPGRAHRGRVFLPFVSSAFCTAAGHPTTAGVVLMGNVGDALRGPTTFTESVFSSSFTGKGRIWHRASMTQDDISTTVAQSRWATQKRRGDYGRVNALPF